MVKLVRIWSRRGRGVGVGVDVAVAVAVAIAVGVGWLAGVGLPGVVCLGGESLTGERGI